MNTAEIRQLFVDLTGRMDLLGQDSGGEYLSTITPAPMDVYLQAGLKTLDRMLATDAPGNVLTQINLERGFNSATLPFGFRQIQAVWLISANNHNSREALRPVKEQSDTGSLGAPETYALASLRANPHLSQTEDFVATPQANVAIPTPGPLSLLFDKRADQKYIVQIIGVAHNFVPQSEFDSCWWFVEHPLLAAKSAAYHLEVAYRNTEGANDWLRAVAEDMRQLNADWIVQEEGKINDWIS